MNAMTNSPISTLHNLLHYDARKFISAEIQLKSSLKDWVEKAGSLKLKMVLQKYLQHVEKHIQVLSTLYMEEKLEPISIGNRVMQAFIEEANEAMALCSDKEVRDACMLASIQCINHFKISAYGTAAAFANSLGMENLGSAFHEAEINEKQIDDRLTQLAEHEINEQARSPIVIGR